MLMFLRSQSQQQLGDVFRHALRAQGFLFLGDSERVCSPFFFPLDGNPAIYTHLIGVPTKSSRVRILDGLGNSSCTEPDINATGRTQSRAALEEACRSMTAQLEDKQREIRSLQQELLVIHAERIRRTREADRCQRELAHLLGSNDRD